MQGQDSKKAGFTGQTSIPKPSKKGLRHFNSCDMMLGH
jgi:hypothetical protein